MAQASAVKLGQTGPAEKERVASVPQSEQLASTSLAKRKRNRAVCPDHQIVRWEETKGEREPHFGERGRSEWEHGEERVDSTVKKRRFQRGEGKASK